MSECSKCGQYLGPGGPGCCCPALSFGGSETHASSDAQRLAEIRERIAELRETCNGHPNITWELLDTLDDVLAKLDESERALARFEQLGAEAWGDKPLPEDDAIDAAFPTRTSRHDLYTEAMRLVGAKRSKGALVALVNWLLARNDESERARSANAQQYGRDVASLSGERRQAEAALAEERAKNAKLWAEGNAAGAALQEERAKRKAAERAEQAYRENWQDQIARAEAAESRVRELEAQIDEWRHDALEKDFLE